MLLVDAKQFDQQQDGVIFSQVVPFAPSGERLHEVIIKVVLFRVWHRRYLGGNRRSAAASISA